MARRLIVNADDFGASADVNAAVAQARQGGVLTSASLMVLEPAAKEAVRIASGDTDLAVGLHLVVGNSPDPVRSGFALYFSRAARAEAHSSIARQFEAFAETHLPFSHVDGHQHLHAHPSVLPLVVRLAEQYGVAGIRVPNEPSQSAPAKQWHPLSQLATALGQVYLRWCCIRHLRMSRLVAVDRTIGGLMSGRMSSEYVVEALEAISDGVVEVYVHPSLTWCDLLGPNPGDLAALTDGALADYLARSEWQLTSYAQLQAEREAEL